MIRLKDYIEEFSRFTDQNSIHNIIDQYAKLLEASPHLRDPRKACRRIPIASPLSKGLRVNLKDVVPSLISDHIDSMVERKLYDEDVIYSCDLASFDPLSLRIYHLISGAGGNPRAERMFHAEKHHTFSFILMLHNPDLRDIVFLADRSVEYSLAPGDLLMYPSHFMFSKYDKRADGEMIYLEFNSCTALKEDILE